MILRIFLGIVIGFFCTLYHAQNDPWAHKKLERFLHYSLSSTFNCKVTGTVQLVNIFYPTLFIKDLCMCAHDNSWRWSAAEYKSGFSWTHFVKSGVISLWTTMKRVQADSKFENNIPAISPHINELMKGPDFPVPLIMTHAEVRLANLSLKEGATHVGFNWQCSARRDRDIFKTRYRLSRGYVSQQNNYLVMNLTGDVKVDLKQSTDDNDFEAILDLHCLLPHLDELPQTRIQGKINQNGGRVQIENADKMLRVAPFIATKEGDDWNVNGQATFPLSYFHKIYFGDSKDTRVQGQCTIRIKGSVSEKGTMEGYAVCEDLQHPWLSEKCICNGMFSKKDQQIIGLWDIKKGLDQAWQGSIDWDLEKQVGHATCLNETAIKFSPYTHQWLIKPHDASIKIAYDNNIREIDCDHDFTFSKQIGDSKVHVQGSNTLLKDNLVKCSGKAGSFSYSGNGSLVHPFLNSFEVTTHSKKRIADCFYEKEKNSYQATINFSLIQSIALSLLSYDIHGEGVLRGGFSYNDRCIDAHLALDNATVRLPQTYNFLSNASGRVQLDLNSRKVNLQDFKAKLHSGSLSCPDGILWLNKEWLPSFVHIPFYVDRCLVTAKQDLFAVISSNLLLSKKKSDRFLLAGNVLINRAQLKENLFSDQLQKKFLASTNREYKEVPVDCGLHIETKEPIRIDTPFLQANGNVDINVSGPIASPCVEGTIKVPTGTIGFPYKPLEVSKGEIHFVKGQTLNPLIELAAKNTVKNHHITLNVTGSLQDNMVLLESTPPLTQEQIVGLLVAGAHEDSLDALIPALLMKNVTNYILSSHKSNFFDRFIKPWMKQVNVHLKPNFGDQSGRGGLRGTLEITLNDRWRALIEKNFTLTEDTHFELEYILSDDVTFRMIRDERRDIGGEVEMKWKF